MKKRGFIVGLCAGVMLFGTSVSADFTAQRSNQPIYVDGERAWDMTAYDIGGNNYVKLRDMGQAVGFDVTYDAATGSIHIDPTKAYSGSTEGYVLPQTPARATAKISIQPIYVQGKRVQITAYEIKGNNYMKLRDLGNAIGFGVAYDATTGSVYIDATTPYRLSLKNESYAPTEKPQQGTISDESGEDAVQIVFQLINEAREAEGVAPLVLDDDLCRAAEIRAKELQELASHTRPDGTKFSTVLEDTNISWNTLGENLAMGQKTAEEVMEDWMNSHGHRKNILNPAFVRVGIAKYQEGWLQLFAG